MFVSATSMPLLGTAVASTCCEGVKSAMIAASWRHKSRFAAQTPTLLALHSLVGCKPGTDASRAIAPDLASRPHAPPPRSVTGVTPELAFSFLTEHAPMVAWG